MSPLAGFSITIHVGDQVIWQWDDFIPHTVTSGVKDLFNSGLRFAYTFSYTFQTPGQFSYVCEAHPEMMFGVITVLP
jgi:plastocyanin